MTRQPLALLRASDRSKFILKVVTAVYAFAWSGTGLVAFFNGLHHPKDLAGQV